MYIIMAVFIKLSLMKGIKRERYQIEPDVSAACYFYAAAITGGKALVRHVHENSYAGRYKILSIF